MNRKILLTGGAGFIGSHLSESLLRQGDHVVCIDNFDPFYGLEIKKKNLKISQSYEHFEFVEMDIRDEKAFEQLKGHSFDAIIHLAGKAGVRPSISDPLAYQNVNVNGTQNLLEFAKNQQIKQFVFASSSSVYGVNPRVPWRESDSDLQPISPYASTKISCELLGHVYHKLYGLRFIALRFFTVYGPRQRPDLAIHKFTKKILEKQPIPVFGDGSSKRDYTYVDDIVGGIEAALDYNKTDFEVINLGNSDTVMLSDLIACLEKAIGIKAIIDRQPMQPGDVPQTFASIEKALNLLGYNPVTKIDKGIEKFVRWYKEEIL